MTNGIFKTSADSAHARAQVVMSTKSDIGFEWSIKLIDTGSFSVGVASMLKPNDSEIYLYDKNAILYSRYLCRYFNEIRVGSKTMHSNLTSHKNGDVIRFRFQPQSKKLLIDLVRKNTPKLRKL